MPQRHDNAGILIGVSDAEVGHEMFDQIFNIKWSRMSEATKSYSKKNKRALISRNAEGDGFNVLVYVDKMTLREGTPVPIDEAAVRSEILSQYGEQIA